MAEKNLKPGWKVWRFDQIATSVNVRIDNPSKSGMEHYVGLEHLDPDSLRIRRWGSPSDVEAGKLFFKTGDIIFAKRRAYQRKLGVAEFDGICSAHAMVLRAKPEVVLPEFLPFFMQSDLFMNRAVAISVGSLSPTINWKTMAVQEFVLPPVDEQRRLADLILAINDVVQTHVELTSDSKVLLEASFEATQAQDQFPLQAIEDVCDLIMDFRGRTPKKLNLDWGGGEIPALSASNVLHRRLDLEKETNYGSEVLYQKWMTKGPLLDGDVLFTTEAPLGNVYRLKGSRPYILSQRVIAMRVKRDLIIPEYFEALLCSRSFRRELDRLATGSTAKGIRVASLSTIRLAIPPLDYQRKWASRILDISEAEANAIGRLDASRMFAKQLLNEALAAEA